MSVETDLLASVVIVVCQSLVYGVFVVLMPMSTGLLVKRGLTRRVNHVMLVVIWVMFSLSTAHWALSLTFLVAKVKTPGFVKGPIRVGSDVMNAIVTINYGVADGVVVWRVWVLCKDEYKKALVVSFILLGLNAASIVTTIALRGAIALTPTTSSDGHDESLPIHQALDIIQIIPIGFSLIINVSSTIIVGSYVWQYRRFLRESLSRNRSTRVERILVLIFESGLLFALYLIFTIICSHFRVSIGTIGDVTNSVLAHISGLYPTIIITLVSIQGTAHSSTFSVSSVQTRSVLPVSGMLHGAETSLQFNQNPALLTHNTIEDDQDWRISGRRTSIRSLGMYEHFQVETFELAQRGWDGPWFDKSGRPG